MNPEYSECFDSEEPISIIDVGYTLDKLANMGRVGLVFDRTKTLTNEAGEKHRGVSFSIIPDSAMHWITGAYVDGRMTKEDYERAILDAKTLEPEHFLAQYPEFNLQSGQQG